MHFILEVQYLNVGLYHLSDFTTKNNFNIFSYISLILVKVLIIKLVLKTDAILQTFLDLNI
jgi:hypothetical protein